VGKYKSLSAHGTVYKLAKRKAVSTHVKNLQSVWIEQILVGPWSGGVQVCKARGSRYTRERRGGVMGPWHGAYLARLRSQHDDSNLLPTGHGTCRCKCVLCAQQDSFFLALQRTGLIPLPLLISFRLLESIPLLRFPLHWTRSSKHWRIWVPPVLEF